jgi:hypothetical protein
MNIYSIYVNPEKENESFVSVQNGFSLTAAIFGFFWALYHKMWKIALVMAAIYIVIFCQNEDIVQVVTPVMNILNICIFGMFATDMREYNLEKNGYKLRDVVLASSQVDSEIKFLTRNN